MLRLELPGVGLVPGVLGGGGRTDEDLEKDLIFIETQADLDEAFILVGLAGRAPSRRAPCAQRGSLTRGWWVWWPRARGG